MAYAMTKQGSLDNCVTYEFICDAVEDMNAIEDRYRTIGTVAIVLSGASGLEVYIAGSDKQWNSLSSIGGSAASDTAGLSIYICAQDEVSEGVPDVELPDEYTLYLVPAADPDSGNLYDEYIYVEDEWEKFGSGGSAIDLSAYATKASPVFTGSISLGRASGSTIGDNSVAEGYNIVASGDESHAEGNGELEESKTINGTTYTTGGAYGEASHAEGYGTLALKFDAHAEGYETVASGEDSHAEGSHTTASGNQSHTEGESTTASGDASHAEGADTVASGWGAHAEGEFTTASGTVSHAEGYGNKNSNYIINNTTYTGTGAHGTYSHAEGIQTWAIGSGSHSEGQQTIASGNYSHAEGDGEFYEALFIDGNSYTAGGAYGAASHAEGGRTLALGYSSHAEGYRTTALGLESHAEGDITTASGESSHAEGSETTAAGKASHAEGVGTHAKHRSQHVIGEYNVLDSSSSSAVEFGNYIEIVGNGEYNNLSNARTLDWAGNERLMGDIYVGCNANSTGGTKLPRIPEASSTNGTYILQAIVTNGTPTYSWVSLSSLSGVTF